MLKKLATCLDWAVRFSVSAVCCLAMAPPCFGQPLERGLVQLHPWQVPKANEQVEAYFTNLQDGATIDTPFVLKFGLSGGWGLAPISAPLTGKAGHHHLLINRDLPLDIKQPLPFTDQYLHFGKGQMQKVIDLPPGKHTLRLLLADAQHVLHFVYSKPLNITVAKRSGIDAKTLDTKGLELLNITDGARVKGPFRLQFHAAGYSIAHASQKIGESARFRLKLVPTAGGKPVELDFLHGQTETWLQPPPGNYTAVLSLIDNTQPDVTLQQTKGLSLTVIE